MAYQKVGSSGRLPLDSGRFMGEILMHEFELHLSCFDLSSTNHLQRKRMAVSIERGSVYDTG